MSRLNNVPNQNLKHFSHSHELELWNATCFQDSTLCSCCKLPLTGYVYGCRPCNFILHSTCVHFPCLITHPSHPNHTLVLLPSPSYPGGIFNCDACNSQGNGFSYHCSICEYDVHVTCASKPLTITVQFHSCPLELTFKNPYDNAKGFHCDVCRKIESKQWLYRCSSCEFDLHLNCTIAGPTPVNEHQVHFLQHHHHSFSGEIVHNQNQPNQYMPSASTSTVLDVVYGASTESIPKMVVPPTKINNLMNVVIEGLDVIEGDGDDGSSFPSSIFGDS